MKSACFLTVKAMPHGSEKSPEKNRNEIRHSLCMPDGRIKIVANYEENDTSKPQIVKKTSSFVGYLNYIDVLTTKIFFKHRGTAFDDVKRFLWQRNSDILWLLGTYIGI